jgi:hypothetical protein
MRSALAEPSEELSPLTHWFLNCDDVENVVIYNKVLLKVVLFYSESHFLWFVFPTLALVVIHLIKLINKAVTIVHHVVVKIIDIIWWRNRFAGLENRRDFNPVSLGPSFNVHQVIKALFNKSWTIRISIREVFGYDFTIVKWREIIIVHKPDNKSWGAISNLECLRILRSEPCRKHTSVRFTKGDQAVLGAPYSCLIYLIRVL